MFTRPDVPFGSTTFAGIRGSELRRANDILKAAVSFFCRNQPATNNAYDLRLPWVREHIEQYLASGADVDFQMREDLILLYTLGGKTGQIRRVAVVHYPDGRTWC